MKLMTGLAATALLAATLAAPADARHRRDRDEVDAGDVIAGAVIVGGLAALFSAGSSERRRAKEDAAVDVCASEAEYRVGGRISEILHVGRRKGFYTVEGLLDDEGDGLGRQTSFTCTVRRGTIYSFRTGEAFP